MGRSEYVSNKGVGVSIRLLSFYFGGPKTVNFFTKIEFPQRKLLHFVIQLMNEFVKKCKYLTLKTENCYLNLVARKKEGI